MLINPFTFELISKEAYAYIYILCHSSTLTWHEVETPPHVGQEFTYFTLSVS